MADRTSTTAPNVETNESLISRVCLRNQNAMAEIYDRFASIVYSVALRILREQSPAEEVMQEVFMHIWRNPDLYNSGHGSLCSLLALIARNRAIDMLRDRRPEDRIDDGLLASRIHVGDLARQTCASYRVRQAMNSLPIKQRRALEIFFLKG